MFFRSSSSFNVSFEAQCRESQGGLTASSVQRAHRARCTVGVSVRSGCFATVQDPRRPGAQLTLGAEACAY